MPQKRHKGGAGGCLRIRTQSNGAAALHGAARRPRSGCAGSARTARTGTTPKDFVQAGAGDVKSVEGLLMDYASFLESVGDPSLMWHPL